MKFPIGGKVRKPLGTNRCNYGTDSIVWMKEEKLNINYRVQIAKLLFKVVFQR